MTFPFKNLVFEGGGVKGIAFVGALYQKINVNSAVFQRCKGRSKRHFC